MVAIPKIYGLFKAPRFAGGQSPAWKARLEDRMQEAHDNERHWRAVSRLPCTLCAERRGVQAYLLTGPATKKAQLSVPLCLVCRARLSGVGPRKEEQYFLDRGVQPYDLAHGLREKTGHPERMALVLLRFKMQAQGLRPDPDRRRGR